MILYINTTAPDEMIIALRSETKTMARRKIKSVRNQAEKLVPAIDALLKKNRVALRKLKKIIVAARGGSFTSLRIGVITANALAYALKIPVEAEEINDENGKKFLIRTKKFGIYSLVEPLYDREPTIGQSKKPLP
ncbi:MAG: tRNA (adenosine(37)-N6)-threonylcarbamoyltransferase complex dimerization subunit type 1 TsaB [Patescibacteria group bacterium]|jgi:hypothetical protein